MICNSFEETKKFASRLSKKFQNGQVIALNGDLGSGKTTFSQGIAEGLGIKQHVGSPTFKLVSEYTGEVLKLAVKRMLQSGALAKKQLSKLKIYSGADHPHTAQNPKILEINKLNKKNTIRK